MLEYKRNRRDDEMANIFEILANSKDRKFLKKAEDVADKVIKLEDKYKSMTNKELKEQTNVLKSRLAKGESLDDILEDAFAVVRETSSRVLNMKHFKVQIIGGYILHHGDIAEMKTGEGKTLVATLPAYLNALTGKGVHVVTVNDYLAYRDKTEMGKIYNFLGLTTGCILSNMDGEERRLAYNCDITYGTNNEFGFDYLKDNMVKDKKDLRQRELNYAIIDEVDSILIDEARTPLIISGLKDKPSDIYILADRFVKSLTGRILEKEETKSNKLAAILDEGFKEESVDFLIDEKLKTVSLTDKGIKKAEDFFKLDNLADPENILIMHHIDQALKANNTLKKDTDYVVIDGKVYIVDEFTGRIMDGRRFGEGLHQAIEAKEGVEIKPETKTLATITFQNLFRLYDKISGMTGTAKTEEIEFLNIYNMKVYEVPTNKPIKRKDCLDVLFFTKNGKDRYIINLIKERHEKGQPILVGTSSVVSSESLSNKLKKAGIKHNVLNAKQHEKEAEIVAQAGRFGAVTIATNMAGRGTDILLGGNPSFMAKKELEDKYEPDIIEELDSYEETNDEVLIKARKEYDKLFLKYKEETDKEKEKVKEVGGLFIIGSERNESRRIDNQLRGRAGRQGDEGESQFFVSFEDDLLRLFGGERVDALVSMLKMSAGDMSIPIENKMLSNSIEKAQKQIEGANFNARKYVLQYDDIINIQRKIIYEERNKVLNGVDISDHIKKMFKSVIDNIVDTYNVESIINETYSINDINKALIMTGYIDDEKDFLTNEDILNNTNQELKDKLYKKVLDRYKEVEDRLSKELLREVERDLLLRIVDVKWMDHIDAMSQLRQGIGLRSIGQHDPVIAYQLEGYKMFNEMLLEIWRTVTRSLLNVVLKEDIDKDNEVNDNDFA